MVSLDRPYDLTGAYMFLAHERNLIQLAERIGVPLAYATSMDLAADPGLLAGASALISGGHDEYWTPPERANVTAARDAGVNVAFLGANAMFRRIRLAGSRWGRAAWSSATRPATCRTRCTGRTTRWSPTTTGSRRTPTPSRRSPACCTSPTRPTRPTWSWSAPTPGCSAAPAYGGHRFPGLVGIEYDRVNPDYPVQRPIEILSHSPLTCRGVHSYSDSAYYTHPGGAGVFNAGTMRWVRSFSGDIGYGIDQRTGRFVRQVTANVLRAFADGPAAEKYPARDNLAEMHEWAGDPIGTRHNLW